MLELSFYSLNITKTVKTYIFSISGLLFLYLVCTYLHGLTMIMTVVINIPKHEVVTYISWLNFIYRSKNKIFSVGFRTIKYQDFVLCKISYQVMCLKEAYHLANVHI